MSRLVLKNIIIEKSAKDIKTGVNYEFSEGFNIICGNNEAGKSSLMNFIKQGFFREKGVDTGKIYFCLTDGNIIENYRADIKDARLTEPRLKLFDENNNSLNYNFIEKNINQKYFEQGFFISLDDLMSIQNKNTSVLVDIIKDPSGEKLNSYIEEKKAEAKKILGENNRLTKEITLLLDRISNLNTKINELSNNEAQYNNAVNSIKSLSGEIENLCGQEEYVNILIEHKKLRQQFETKENEYCKLKLNFNEKLFKDKETYLNIIHNAGRYESDLKAVEKHKSKSEQLISEINSDIKRLNSEFTLNFDENRVQNYNLDFSQVKKIKDLISQKNSLEKELIALITNKENTEENLLKLKHELKPLYAKTNNTDDINKFKKLYSFLDESLKQYNFLLSKISNTESEFKSKSLNSINKKQLIFFGIIFFLTVITALAALWQKVSPVISSAVIFILFIAGIAVLITNIIKNKKNPETTKDELIKNELLNDIKEKLEEYYPEIIDIESFYLSFKAESIKSDIYNKIQNYKNINELIENNKQQTDYNSEKLNMQNDKIAAITEKITEIKKEIQSIINSFGFNIEEAIFLDVINIIKNIKENIEEKDILLKEIQDLIKENEIIQKNLNSFIINNEIIIPLSEKYEENISKIKEYNDNNSEIKRQLDILNVEIQNIKAKQEKLNIDNSVNDEICDFNLENKLEEINKEKEEKNNQKREAEYKKRELESFEGLSDLKIERNILLDSYRKKISELVKNKMIISLIETAKNNFNKICPDLKNAQKYLSILTDGKYSLINLDLAEIQNEDKTITKKWEELSRGTKEQLYLALRLGYASNYSKDKNTLEPNGRADLSVIIDDAFVNFDKIRTENAIKCLLEFSKTNQVLFFTCHYETMKKHIETLCLAEKINIINL